MKRADASGAAYAIILGEDEVAGGVASVKAMRAADMQNNQTSVPLDAVTEYLVDQMIGGDDHCCY
jgi:histidyl-tRNA synthetase